MATHGLILDMDGTLVDAPLDFAHIRRELGIAAEAPILETIAQSEPARRKWQEARLLELELEAGRNSTPIEGVPEFLKAAGEQGFLRAIFTRNAREVALLVQKLHSLEIDILVAREDCVPKPDPAGLWQIGKAWNLETHQLLYFGDFHYDLEAGRRAGIRTLLYVPGEMPAFAKEAHAVYRSYAEAWEIVRNWKTGPFKC
jgi:HAD superfamily hydrolase (TIGR01509 family)